MVNPRYLSNTLGSGPIAIELWLDYICPYSKKQFDSIYKEVAPAVEKKFPGKFTFVFLHQPQPWHGQGSYLHESAIAVGQIDPSKFWEFSYQLFAKSIEYYDVNAYEKSRKQIIDEIADIAANVGVDRKKFLELTSFDLQGEAKNPGSKVVDDLKYFIKLGRQNGIHVSPTVLINGLQDPSISSSWTTDQWLEKLESTLHSVENKL